jgi:hypothetical protein
MIQFDNCSEAFATVACIGCCVAVFRYLLDKWKISDYIDSQFKGKVCHWCFYSWWPCAVWCFIELPMHSLYELLFIPVSVVIATIGYVYLKSQP